MNPRLLRVLIPLALIPVAILLVWSQLRGPAGGTGGTTPPTTPEIAQQSPADPGDRPTEVGPVTGQEQLDTPTDEEIAEKAEVEPAEGLEGLRFRRYGQPPALTPLGNLDPTAGETTAELVRFSAVGGGVEVIVLRDYFKTLDHSSGNRYVLGENAPINRPMFGLRALWVDGQYVNAVEDSAGELILDAWHESAPGVFEAVIENEAGEAVLTIRRRFVVGEADGELRLEQQVINNAAERLSLVIEQYGPGDLPYNQDGYGDYRRVRFGYLDPRSESIVFASHSDYLQTRQKVIDGARKRDEKAWKEGRVEPNLHLLWPNETSLEKNYTLSWVATTNRHFGIAVFPAPGDDGRPITYALRPTSEVEFWLAVEPMEQGQRLAQLANPTNRYMSLKMISPAIEARPNEVIDLSMAMYAGPLAQSSLEQEPFSHFNLSELIVYQLGCAMCTFQWLAHFLLWFLRLIEGDLLSIGGVGIGVHDWGIAIIILVICVRTLLHPLTRKGQVAMMRTSRQMAKLQPQLQKLREKYPDDSRKVQEESFKLYRENNVNFAGCLGILPTLLQTPIWIALYAMLYFAIELRHQPAFYGVFQMLNNWSFLADLSQPDHLYVFPTSFRIGFWHISGINVLPLLMGAVFYVQQKYLTPQSASLSPDQERQQKIMRIMMIVLMPLMLYSAPSGLTLYIITSSTIGIIESRYIRAHVDALELEPEKAAAKPGKAAAPVKKGGFRGRWADAWRKAMEEAARRQEASAKSGKSRTKGKGR